MDNIELGETVCFVRHRSGSFHILDEEKQTTLCGETVIAVGLATLTMGKRAGVTTCVHCLDEWHRRKAVDQTMRDLRHPQTWKDQQEGGDVRDTD